MTSASQGAAGAVPSVHPAQPARISLNEQLSSLANLLLSVGNDRNPLPYLRSVLPGLALVRCDTEDMRGITPYRRSGRYDMFLVDTVNHCWRIIDDPLEASGVVIAPHPVGN